MFSIPTVIAWRRSIRAGNTASHKASRLRHGWKLTPYFPQPGIEVVRPLDRAMSFDVFVQTFRNGEFHGISRQRVRDAFGLYLTEPEPNFWQLRYDDANSCDLYLNAHDSDASLVHGFTVNRPCGDHRLWDSLAFILTLSEVVIYFPGGRAPLVAHSGVAQHLPPNMVEALGQPIVVASGREILHEIQTA